MNRERMHERLEDFKALCEVYNNAHGSALDGLPPAMRNASDEMASRMSTVRQILSRLDTPLVEKVKEPEYIGGALSSSRAVQQGLSILRDHDEVKPMWSVTERPRA